MENQIQDQKLVRVYNKITVERVCVFEIPETDYKRVGENEDGEAKYDYIPVPGKFTTKEEKEMLYDQKFDDGDLDVKELALWANRVK